MALHFIVNRKSKQSLCLGSNTTTCLTKENIMNGLFHLEKRNEYLHLLLANKFLRGTLPIIQDILCRVNPAVIILCCAEKIQR